MNKSTELEGADGGISTEAETMLEDDEFEVFVELSFLINVSFGIPGVNTWKMTTYYDNGTRQIAYENG